jgi:hypothetical protein
VIKPLIVISTYEEKNQWARKKKSLTAVKSQGGQPAQIAGDESERTSDDVSKRIPSAPKTGALISVLRRSLEDATLIPN